MPRTIEDDRAYFARRADEERAKARDVSSAARTVHRDLADLYAQRAAEDSSAAQAD